MAYNTKPIVRDVDGNPISQYYNPTTDQYEPVEGSHGANKVLVENNDLSLIVDKLSQLTGTVIDEETRKQNEIVRQNTETTREDNENIRQSNESTRQSNENARIEAENVRKNNEDMRIANENNRKNNETERITAEQARENAESERQSNELIRQQNESIRQSNEDLRIALYNDLLEKVASGYFKGEKGETGNGLEYMWDGTKLGIRVEGETEYVFVDLRGPQGPAGNIDNLTSQHIETALGYTPVKSVNNVLADETGNVELDIDTSEIENRIGNVENNLAAHKAEMATNAHLAENIGLMSLSFEADNVEDGMDELKDEVDSKETPSGAQAKANAALNAAKQYTDEEVGKIADDLDAHKADIIQQLSTKVDKVAGKGLSTNDYTDEEKQKNQDNADNISNLQQELETHKAEIATQEQLGHVKAGQNITIDSDGTINATGGNVDSVNGKTGEVVIDVRDIAGLVSTRLALGKSASAMIDFAVALGFSASAESYSSVAIGDSSSAAGDSSVALGKYASAESYSSVAIGHNASAENAGEGILGVDSNKSGPDSWKVPGSFTVSGTKNFEIPHPKPEKSATHVIRHGAVESPTPGDTLYRWKIQATKENDMVTIDLPDYFIWLNKDVQIFVTPQGHFGNGYGELNRETEQLEIHCQFAGEYNVLVIGTRNDDHPSVQEWYIKGVEREIGESWTGETYMFSVDEIIEIEEIKEVSA